MKLEERIALVREVGEEIVTEQDLKTLFETKKKPVAYDGFEPSGKIHVAQGLMRSYNVNKMVEAGCEFKMLVADWHAWANNKLGGDLEAIQKCGDYFVEVWKAAGMNLDHVEFVRVSDYVEDEEYWKKVMQVARHSTLQRVLRTTQIMGRSEKDTLQASQILYPCMQAADIFQLKADICQLGMDQRKVNILAREIGPKIGFYSPVAVHHHMLMGLGEPLAANISKLTLWEERYVTKTTNGVEYRITLRKNDSITCEPSIDQYSAITKDTKDWKQLGPFQARVLEVLGKDLVSMELKENSTTMDRAISLKMSKSKPDTAIFVTDSMEEVKRKLSKAYCPAKEAKENPVLEYAKYLVFEGTDSMEIKRPEKFGGNAEFNSYQELEQAFIEGKVHPMDLKNSVAEGLNDLLEPVRKHFSKGKAADL